MALDTERRSGIRTLLALLLVASAAAFATGRLYEQSVERSEERTEAQAFDTGEQEENGGPNVEIFGMNWETGKIFGMDSDATPLTVVGVLLTLLLAVGVALSSSRILLLAVALFSVAFFMLDVAWELVRQIDKSRTSLVVAAALVGAVHVAVAMAAISALRAPGQPQRPLRGG